MAADTQATGLTYSVDLALCVDATGTMSPVIELVKGNALRFVDDVAQTLSAKQKRVDALRVRTIVFRDLHEDGDAALSASPFFVLPGQRGEFAGLLRSVRAHGGGDEPESGLEALATAMRWAWARVADRKRHVVVVWTDASAHRLEDASRRGTPGYPQNLPRDWAELSTLWAGGMDRFAKRLLIYAPDVAPWTDIQEEWESVVHIVSQAGRGLSEFDYADVLGTIANSI